MNGSPPRVLVRDRQALHASQRCRHASPPPQDLHNADEPMKAAGDDVLLQKLVKHCMLQRPTRHEGPHGSSDAQHRQPAMRPCLDHGGQLPRAAPLPQTFTDQVNLDVLAARNGTLHGC
jgi:hypothetical protein